MDERGTGPFHGFYSPPMATDLTLNCAEKFRANLEDPQTRIAAGKRPGHGPDSLLRDIAEGRIVSTACTSDEALALLLAMEAKAIT